MMQDSEPPSMKRMLSVVCIGSILYGVLNALSNHLLLPTAPVIAFRPQAALPMTAGLVYGPVVGFLTGFMGNLLGDGLSGYGLLNFWHWHIGNGIMGCIPGLLHLLGIRRITTIRDFGAAELSVVISSAGCVGFAVLADVLWVKQLSFPQSMNSWIWPAFLTDTVNGLVLVPLLLLFWKRLIITLETRTMLAVVYLLLAAVLGTASAVTWSVSGDLTSRSDMVRAVYFSGLVTVVVLFIGFLVSAFLAKRVTDPINRLTRAATEVEKGDYDIRDLDAVSARTDEFGHLARVLQGMAREVHEREEALKQQVRELRIEIDRGAQEREVSEIVESDYFKALKEKVKVFRKD
jgi:energy-coupling factor transport system substrate-specific component